MGFDKLIKHGFVRHLTALAVGLASCPAGATELADLPDDVVTAILDDAEVCGWSATDRKVALLLAIEDPRPAIRRRAAAGIGACGFAVGDLETAVRQLSADPEPEVRAAASASLSAMLERATPLERTAVAGELATAEEPRVREALARALARPVWLLGLTVIFERLAVDPDADVRRAISDAAHARAAAEPELLRAVLAAQLAELDLDPESA